MFPWMNGILMEYCVVSAILKRLESFIPENMLELIYQMINKNRFSLVRVFVFI